MTRSLAFIFFISLVTACGGDPKGDPCEDDPCFVAGSCRPGDGDGFSCDPCPPGTEGDGVTCEDEDPCRDEPCFMSVACTDVPAPGTGFMCGDCPSGYEGDGVECDDVDGCAEAPCFMDVPCTDVPAPGTGFTCGACPPGYAGDGVDCTDADGCADAPCLPTTECTDLPAPEVGFTCTVCEGPACPILRALAGPDREVVSGADVVLEGSAVGFNGRFDCEWTNDVDDAVLTECMPTVSPTEDTAYTLTVTDASGLTASDTAVMTVVPIVVDAGPDANILLGETATLSGSWMGASCEDDGCIACEWRTSDDALVAETCDVTVSPDATAQYFLSVTDTTTDATNGDSATVFVTDVPAMLCGWNVVVLTSESYPSAGNPNYICDETGTARRQTVNGDPAIVLSDLEVENVRITGHISVETTSDDDLIGFLWGWENPKHYYLLTWKQRNQALGGACGNALSGIAVKKVDGAREDPETISFDAGRGYNVTDYVQVCADGWSTDRNDGMLLSDDTTFLVSPRDVDAFTGGWADRVTYRFEFFYTPTRTKIFVYEDDEMTGSTENLVTTLDITDSSYPAGGFAFYSNSQQDVVFGDFFLASLDDFAADAGDDQTVGAGDSATLEGGATLAVPPIDCAWSDGTSAVPSEDCIATVTPGDDTTYTLTVTDAFGRVDDDDVTVSIVP